MVLPALMLAALLASQDPTELDKLKLEVERLRSQNRDLQRQLDGSNQSLQKRDLVQIARLLEKAYAAFERKQFKACQEACDEVLKLDAGIPVARELKDDAAKASERAEFFVLLSPKVEAWKKATDSGQGMIPWGKMSLVQAAVPKPAEEHHRQAEGHFQKQEYDKAYEEVVKALQADPNLAAARSLLLEIQVMQKYLLAQKDAEMARKKKIFGASFTEISGKVAAVASDIGLVVVSAGSQLGIIVGDEFTVTRKGEFVARVKVDRVDAEWCAGKVVEQTGPPAVGDDALRKDPRNAPATPSLKRSTADEVQSLRKELDDVRNQVRQLTDRLVPSYQGAGFSVEEAPDALRDHLGIQRGLVVRQVRAGSEAAKSGLKPHDVIPDLAEAQLAEILESGKSLPIIRQGLRMTLSARRVR